MTTTDPVLPATDLAQRVADAVLRVDGVHRVGSAFGRAVDRYLPTTRVAGVRLPADGGTKRPTVTIVAEYPVDVVALADRVRHRASTELGGVDVDVVVADVHGPFDRDEPVAGTAVEDAAVEDVATADPTAAAAVAEVATVEDVADADGEAVATSAALPVLDESTPVRPDGTGAAAAGER